MNNRFPKIRILDLRSAGRTLPWCVIYYRKRAADPKARAANSRC